MLPRRLPPELTGHGAPRAVEPISHDRLVLSMHQRCRPGPNRNTGRLEITKQAGGYVLVVKGHDIAAGGEAAYGRRVGVIADRDVVHHRAQPSCREPQQAAAR